MASKGQKFMKVPLETRLKIVEERILERKSYPYLSKKYGVSDNTIRTWVRIYKRDKGLDIRKKGRSTKEENIDYKERYEILKKFQDYLWEVDREKK
ncbi:MAG: helix-turn-helix domain-containing protein [Candidatus Izemoplasmatales bacterium]|jgi:transposase-like protein|nr:helix-turn-helix domain-containing protein [Candidatus Izemoplasmatales bacterium]